MPAYVSFQDLKRRVPLESVLRRYGLWETFVPRRTGSLAGPCPVHKGTHPTQFKANLAKNCWKCFGCGKGGNMLDFVAEMEGKSLRDAALLVQAWFPEGAAGTGGEYRTSDNGPAEPESEDPPDRPPAVPSGSAGSHRNPPLPFAGLKCLDPRHPFLLEQGFSPHTLEHFGVGYCAKGLHAGRIAIPIHDPAGELVAYAGYCPKEKRYVYPEGFRKEWELFNLHRALACRQDWEEFILVADFFDVIRLYEAGCHASVALMGEALGEEQFRLLAEAFEERSELTLFLPHRSEGTLPVAARLLESFYLRIVWPEGKTLRPQDLTVGELWELFRL
jgi:DNA primase